MPSQDQYPCVEDLSAALGSALGGDPKGSLAILDRRPNPYASTFPSEIVLCTKNGQKLDVLCKYDTDTGEETVFNHRSGVDYEAKVYSQILSSCPSAVPKCYGTYSEIDSRSVWLFLEYLKGSLKVTKYPDPLGLIKAARWIGRFHRWSQVHVHTEHASFLKVYDAVYYAAWGHRTLAFDGQQHDWLPQLCERASTAVLGLMMCDPVIIHGEFYPQNVLMRDGAIYPVDWQSAAIGAGEIDLSALTENWPADMVQHCMIEYQAARWPQGAPANFEERFAAANLYWTLRWLGGRPDCTLDDTAGVYLKRLRTQCERLGLIG